MKNIFTKEQKKLLKNHGYTVFSLKGERLTSLREKGMKFWSSWHKGEEFENEKGYVGDVAVRLDKMILEDSKNKTYDEGKRMIDSYIDTPELSSIHVELLTAASYLEILYLHHKKTGEYLMGSEYTWTTTRYSDGRLVLVGDFDSNGAAVLGDWPRITRSDIGVCLSRVSAPLVIDPVGTPGELPLESLEEPTKSEEVVGGELDALGQYNAILAWMYENDMAFESKSSWRKAFLQKLREILEI